MKYKMIILFISIMLLIFSNESNVSANLNQNNGELFSFSILCYHNVRINPKNEYDVELIQFEKQMQYLYENNFTSLFASEVVDLINENKNIRNINKNKNEIITTKKYIAITFDDGNDGVYLLADKILSKYGLKATLYVYPSVIFAKKENNLKHYMTFSQINKLINTNRYELGCHSYYHPYMTKEDEKGLILNTIKAKETLFNQIGFEAKTFAYPFGLYNDKIVDYVRKAGFIGAFTVDRKYVNNTTDIYKIPRFIITNNTSFDKFIQIVNSK